MEIEISNEIRLVPIALKYAEDIFQSFSPEIVKYLAVEEAPTKVEETINFIENSVDKIAEGANLVWVILYKTEFCGCCGIHSIPSKEPHFGLWIKKEMQGKGIGKLVVQYMLQWAIENLDIDFIKYPVDKRNHRSYNLIKHMGLKLSDHYDLGSEKILQIDEYRLYRKENDAY